MGAQPKTALAIAVVHHGSDSRVEETLFQLMAGAVGVLQAAGCSLVGGHTCEGDELSLGTSPLWLKTQMMTFVSCMEWNWGEGRGGGG